MPKPNPALNSSSSKTSQSSPTTPTSSPNMPIRGKKESWQVVTALVSGNGVYWMPLASISATNQHDLVHAKSQYLAATASVNPLSSRWLLIGPCQHTKTQWSWLQQTLELSLLRRQFPNLTAGLEGL